MHTLLLIDPQNDFCDFDGTAPGTPALPVAGADADMQRAAAFLNAAAAQVDRVVVTFDSHAAYGIERPGFWVHADGTPVGAFTQVTAAQVHAGEVRAADPAAQARAEQVVAQLERQGKYTLMVWPTHCVLGTWGHALHADVAAALAAWEVARQRVAVRVLKGQNPLTEHYSAVRAEVVLDDDPHTDTNMSLLRSLAPQGAPGGRIFVAGEAGSHCVAATVRDMVGIDPVFGARLTLLRDCMSPVGGFETAQQDFFDWAQGAGVEVRSAAEALDAYGR